AREAGGGGAGARQGRELPGPARAARGQDRVARMRRAHLLLLCAALGAACARPQAPPGGAPDVRAPALVATAPSPLSVITDLASPVVIRFDERLRVRTFNRTFVSVMPGTPAEMDVSLKGNEIRIRREGGWLAGQVYHVVVRAGI